MQYHVSLFIHHNQFKHLKRILIHLTSRSRFKPRGFYIFPI